MAPIIIPINYRTSAGLLTRLLLICHNLCDSHRPPSEPPTMMGKQLSLRTLMMDAKLTNGWYWLRKNAKCLHRKWSINGVLHKLSCNSIISLFSRFERGCAYFSWLIGQSDFSLCWSQTQLSKANISTVCVISIMLAGKVHVFVWVCSYVTRGPLGRVRECRVSLFPYETMHASL